MSGQSGNKVHSAVDMFEEQPASVGQIVELAAAYPGDERRDLGAGVDERGSGRVPGVPDRDVSTSENSDLDAVSGGVAGRGLAPVEGNRFEVHVQMFMQQHLRMQVGHDTIVLRRTRARRPTGWRRYVLGAQMSFSWGAGRPAGDEFPAVRLAYDAGPVRRLEPVRVPGPDRPTPAPIVPAPTPTGELSQLAAELAPMVDVWQRLLAQHLPDRSGRCRTCTKGGTGLPSQPWPCSIHGIAELARRRYDGDR